MQGECIDQEDAHGQLGFYKMSLHDQVNVGKLSSKTLLFEKLYKVGKSPPH